MVFASTFSLKEHFKDRKIKQGTINPKRPRRQDEELSGKRATCLV
jgi:hypothetical protein